MHRSNLKHSSTLRLKIMTLYIFLNCSRFIFFSFFRATRLKCNQKKTFAFFLFGFLGSLVGFRLDFDEDLSEFRRLTLECSTNCTTLLIMLKFRGIGRWPQRRQMFEILAISKSGGYPVQNSLTREASSSTSIQRSLYAPRRRATAAPRHGSEDQPT